MHFSFLFLFLLLSASPYLFSFLFPLPSPLLLSPPLPIPSPLPFPSLLLSLNFTETQTTAVLRGNHPPWPSLFSWDWRSWVFVVLLVIYGITVIGKVTQLCWSEVTQDSSVLFLGPLFFLDLCYASSDAGSFFPREKNPFLHWLLFSILLFHCPGNHRLLYVYSDGFWPRSRHPKSSSPG